MKIISSINRNYLEQLALNGELKMKVDEIIKTNKKDTWHYFSRIKPEESFALKIETGRFENPKKLEDFFACTVVVENSIEIKNAIEIISQFFDIVERRPKTENFTHKDPESFPYDDLRLYVKLKPKEELPPESVFNRLSDIIFEIQIKTFLQHAWSIATHDLVYKGEEINWAKQRIAYQIKAMLENAEISIYEIEKIKESNIIAKMNKKIKQLNEIKDFLTKNWTKDMLPKDLIRLSTNVSFLLEQLNLTISELQNFLNAESSAGRGVNTTNLSPHFIIIQTIINQNPQKIIEFFNNKDKNKLIIPDEINTSTLSLDEAKIIRF